MAEPRWTEEAASWLESIHSYIAQDNPTAAANVVQAICDRIDLLLEYPEIGYRYRQETGGEVRILLYGHYRIAYLVRPDRCVEILGIFHAALDIDRYI